MTTKYDQKIMEFKHAKNFAKNVIDTLFAPGSKYFCNRYFNSGEIKLLECMDMMDFYSSCIGVFLSDRPDDCADFGKIITLIQYEIITEEIFEMFLFQIETFLFSRPRQITN